MPTLINLFQSNRTEALSKIYQDHRTEFISWAMKNYGCSLDEAKDCYQNAIIILYENVVSGKLTELNSSTKTYLFAIGKNKLRELNRENNKKEDIANLPDVVADDPVEQHHPEAVKLAMHCLEHLGEPCKSLLQEFYYHKSTMAQIMEKLGYKNEDSAKNQKYKCLVRLRKLYLQQQSSTE